MEDNKAKWEQLEDYMKPCTGERSPVYKHIATGKLIIGKIKDIMSDYEQRDYIYPKKAEPIDLEKFNKDFFESPFTDSRNHDKLQRFSAEEIEMLCSQPSFIERRISEYLGKQQKIK